MRKQHIFWWFLLVALGARAEIIDRIAVTVDKIVITESDVINQIRIAALLNGKPLQFSPEARHKAASRLVEQVLIRREMEISRYPAPAPSAVEPMLKRFQQDHFKSAGAYRKALEKYGVSEKELRKNLLLQLTVLRFIDYRFRPGITVDEKQINNYYANRFLPEWKRRSSAPPPSLDDVHDRIEKILISQLVNKALDRWLKQTAARTRIRYRKEAFQ